MSIGYNSKTMVWALNKIIEMGETPRSERLISKPGKAGNNIVTGIEFESVEYKTLLFFKRKFSILIEPVMEYDNPEKVYKNKESADLKYGSYIVKITVKHFFANKTTFLIGDKLFDALERGKLLDAKLQWRLDVLFQKSQMKFVDGKLIIE